MYIVAVFCAKFIGDFTPPSVVKFFKMRFVLGVEDPGLIPGTDDKIWDEARKASCAGCSPKDRSAS
jgi:hypothetical protein